MRRRDRQAATFGDYRKPYLHPHDYAAQGRRGGQVRAAARRADQGLPPAPPRALLPYLREATLQAYLQATEELRTAVLAAVKAQRGGDAGEIRRADRVVWSANQRADRFHDELQRLLRS